MVVIPLFLFPTTCPSRPTPPNHHTIVYIRYPYAGEQWGGELKPTTGQPAGIWKTPNDMPGYLQGTCWYTVEQC